MPHLIPDKEKKLLIIAMPFSSHTERWLASIAKLPLEVHFLSSFEYAKPTIHLDGIIYHDYSDNWLPGKRYKYASLNKTIFPSKNYHIVNLLFGKISRRFNLRKSYSWYLSELIEKLAPDMIHTMETQHAGYLLLEAMTHYSLEKKFKWIHSTWGIDLHYFGEFDDHRSILKNLFKEIDCYCYEGLRDLNIAKDYGYKGASRNFASVGGYYEIEDFKTLPSQRKIILLKGYQNEIRKGINGLKALQMVDLPDDFEIVVYGENTEFLDIAKTMKIWPKVRTLGFIKLEELIRVTKQSIMSITINLSDGLPSTFFEALACGAFPIQSNTSMADEWISFKETGMLVDPNDIEEIANAISWSLNNMETLDKAAIINKMKIVTELNKDLVMPQIRELYHIGS